MNPVNHLIGAALFVLLAANLYGQSSGGGAGGVSQLIAGTNITLSPVGGTGAVTITASSTAATAFPAITAGTNTNALLIGTGGSFGTSGTGTISATSLNGTLLSGLTTGLLKNTTTTGVPTIAVAGTDYLTPAGSATGLSKASAAAFGVAECDGTTITCAGGVFSAIAGGSGTVTTVSVTTANGVSGSVATSTTTPAITLTLGAITPSAVTITGLTGTIQCLHVSTAGLISGTGSDCGSGGSTAFSALTGSTNTTAAMVVGTGASLAVSGSGTITATAAPVSGLTGLGAGVGTFLGTPSSANLLAAMTNETGTGLLVFATGPTITLANATGLPLSTGVTGNLPNANLASQTANTVLGALTATTPSGLAVPSCSTASSALTWTSGTGFGCNSITGAGTVTHTAGALTSGAVVIGNGTADVKVDTGCSTDGAGNLTCASYSTGGALQGIEAFSVGTGTLAGITLPTNYVGIVGPPSGTPTYFLQLPSASPSGGQVMSFATPGTVNGVSQSVGTWVTPAPTASPTFTGTVTIPSGGVFGTPTSVTLTNATGLPTAGLVNNAVTSAKLAVVNTYQVCDLSIGDTSGTAITNAQLGPQSRVCFIPAAATIVEMDVNADAGTPNIIVGRNHAGTIVNIVSAALATAATGGIACSKLTAVAGLNGVTTCSATLQNTSLAAGDYLELVSGTAGGTAKFMVAHVIYTVN